MAEYGEEYEPTAEDYAELGRAVKKRREDLGLSQDDVKLLGGPSTATQRKIERGEPADYRLGTTWPLERVYGWRPGAINGFLRYNHRPPDIAVEVDYTAFRANQDPTPTAGMIVTASMGGSVSAPPQTDDFRYRRPEGVDDAEWERLKAKLAGYWDALVSEAETER